MPTKTKEERKRELQEMGGTAEGLRELLRLYETAKGLPRGTLGPMGQLMIQTIVAHEYPEAPPVGRKEDVPWVKSTW